MRRQQPAIDCKARGWGSASTLPVPWIRPSSRRWRSTREKVSGAMPSWAAIRRLRWCRVTCMAPLWSGWPSLDFLPPGALEGPRTFVARSFAFYGLEASSNTRLEQDYTRALQPFASVSRTWHSRLGPGYGVRLGLAGSLLGADHFSIAWGLSKSGLQSQDRSSEWQLRYRLPF